MVMRSPCCNHSTEDYHYYLFLPFSDIFVTYPTVDLSLFPSCLTNKELDASCSSDLLLVLDALGLQVARVTVQDVDVVRVNVDVLEEVVEHVSTC